MPIVEIIAGGQRLRLVGIPAALVLWIAEHAETISGLEIGQLVADWRGTNLAYKLQRHWPSVNIASDK